MKRNYEQAKTHRIKYKDNRDRACHLAFKTSVYEGYKNINPIAVQGTFHWVVDHPQYRRWLTSPKDDLLWVSANEGCGKSVLSRFLIDAAFCHDGNIDPRTVCYFFFRDNGYQNRLGTALCAIIHQIFAQHPDLIHHAHQRFIIRGDELPRYTEELWHIFQSIANDEAAPLIVCAFDGLDECHKSDQDQLFKLLGDYYNGPRDNLTATNRLKWLVSSCPSVVIGRSFKGIPSTLSTYHLRAEHESNDIRADIEMVLQTRIRELSQEFQLSATGTKEVIRQLSRVEGRTHLWLYLAIDAIKKQFYDASTPVKEPSPLVATSVEHAYELVLEKLDDTQRKIAMAFLTIVVGARRPLTIEEMVVALHVSILPETTASRIDLAVVDSIRRLCEPFVVVHDGRIYLLHDTAKGFLLRFHDKPFDDRKPWEKCMSFSEVEKRLATICISFLSLPKPDMRRRNAGVAQIKASKSTLQKFFEYTAQNWASHTRITESNLDEDIRSKVKALYDKSSLQYSDWTSAMWQTTNHWWKDFGMNRIQLAAFNGHNETLREFLAASLGEIDSQDVIGCTALIWASSQGHLDVVQTLLDMGANINARGSSHHGYSSALHAASTEGHSEVVKVLLDRGAKMNTHNRNHSDLSSALHAAAAGGHLEMVRVLLDKSAGTGKQVSVLDGALEVASAKGYLEIVRLLLDNGADANTRKSETRALYAASVNGHLTIVRLLLDRGAKINASGSGDLYGSALQGASGHGQIVVVRALLEKGADPALQDVQGSKGSALQMASRQGHLNIVKTLLDAGADANEACDFNGSALSYASGGGHMEIVQILLERGADINASGPNHGSPLQQASSWGHTDVVQLLLDKGALVDIEGGFYGSALQAAASRGYLALVKMLIDHGADVNVQGGHCGPALRGAAMHGHEKVMEILIKNGANKADGKITAADIPFYRPS